jgi:transposase InsO family protein
MPNQLPDWMERKVIAFALAWPGLWPRRIAAQLARAADGMQISPSGVLKAPHRDGLGTRRRRLSLVSGYAAPPEPERPRQEEKLHLEADQPGDLVQFDCFHVGRLTGTKGRVWQYTAIDVASSYVWAKVHRTHLNPSARYTTVLARRVAAELAVAGWKLKANSTDNASEFRSVEFRQALVKLAGRASIHSRRQTPDEWLCGTSSADHPRGVLATNLCSLFRA